MSAASRPGPAPPSGERAAPAPPRRSWLSIRWRQFRNAPRPVVRAVGSSVIVASILGLAYLAYDLAVTLDPGLPGGDLRVGAAALYVLGVLVAGSVITWLIVPLPRGSGERATRTPWSAALGLFAAVPVAYLVLVIALEVVKPLLLRPG